MRRVTVGFIGGVVLIGLLFVGYSPAFSQEGEKGLSKQTSPLFYAALKNSQNSLSSSDISIAPGISNQSPIMMAASDSEDSESLTEKILGENDANQILPTMGRTCQTCGVTCAGATCAATCAGATCSATCGGATCGATCGGATCGGATCGRTCAGAQTCGLTCQGVTCGSQRTCSGPGCQVSPSR